jgi:50S ribosomal subunit-associated GTPase HflX
MEEIGVRLRPVREFLELAVPYGDSAVMARLHEVGQVVESKFNGAKARFKVRIPPHLHGEFERYVIKDLTRK